MIKGYKLTITGDVQGVFYRHFAKKKAEHLGLTGWVKNEQDGSVTLVAQGEQNALSEMVKWAHHGSPMASVEAVSVEETPVNEGYLGFSVK